MHPPQFLQSLSHRRDLWWQFAARAVETRHRGSYLGVLWTVLNPLLMLAMYVTVFGFIFKSRFQVFPDETPVDYALGVFLGLLLFHVTSETIAAAPSYIVANPNLVKKVVFPLEILPLANVSALWFNFLISFGLLLVCTVVGGRPASFSGLAWMPLIFGAHVLFTVGLGWFLSALGVFFRDVAQIVTFLTQVLLYASAIFYPVHKIHEESALLWDILKWNPLLQTVDLARGVLLWDRSMDLYKLAFIWVLGVAVFFIGGWFFKRLQPAFADVI
jgi:lipopolysaccharide transport system permease protein